MAPEGRGVISRLDNNSEDEPKHHYFRHLTDHIADYAASDFHFNATSDNSKKKMYYLLE
jgi:hypothetical protein